MDDRFNILAGAILDKPLDQCTVMELQNLADKYPFFAPAHFLLLKKKESAGEDVSTLTQRSILYFHHPLAFEHFIHPKETDERFLNEAEKLVLPITPPFTEERVAEPVRENPEKAEEPLAFEPFHTVDYFASQGIRPSKEEPRDTLGRQLKSFTDWLRTMKKLPDTASASVKVTDPAVEAMATRSVDHSPVVTEAMAEVWMKQGNKERATDIYRKLSLLDPSKSAYFTAKIDNLKAD